MSNNERVSVTIHQIANLSKQITLLHLLEDLLTSIQAGEIEYSQVSPLFKTVNGCAEIQSTDPSFQSIWELVANNLQAVAQAAERKHQGGRNIDIS